MALRHGLNLWYDAYNQDDVQENSLAPGRYNWNLKLVLGNPWNQGISSNGINLVLLEYSNLSTEI